MIASNEISPFDTGGTARDRLTWRRQLMPSPNHGTLRLPNDDAEEDTVSYG